MLEMDIGPIWEDVVPPQSGLLASINWKRVGMGVATGGLSEVARGVQGEESIYDPLLEGAGLGIDRVEGPPPSPDTYFKQGESQASDIYKRALAEADRAGNYAHPSGIRDPNQLSAPQVTASTIESPEHGITHDAGPVERVHAGQVLDPGETRLGDLGPVERIGSFGELNSRDVGPVGVKHATVNPAAEGLLTEAAMGKGPSQAAEQLKYAADLAAKKRFSLASGARGAERAGARIAAMQQTGEDLASLGQASAAARAGEMATARGQLADFAQRSAALEQQANSLQAEIDKAVAQGNQAQANALKVRQTELEAERQKINAAMENERTMDVARLATGLSEAGKNRSVAVGEGNAGRTLSGDIFSAGAQNTRSENFAKRADETDEQYFQRLQRTREANANAENRIAEGNADRTYTAGRDTANLTLDAQKSRDQSELEAERVRQAGLHGALNVAGNATGQTIGIGETKYNAASGNYNAAKAREAAQKGARTQAVLTGVGMAMGGPAGAKAANVVGGGLAPGPTDRYGASGVTQNFEEGLNDVGAPLQYPDNTPLGPDEVYGPEGGVSSNDDHPYGPQGYALAHGGIVTGPEQHLIGEAGPEMVVPLSTGSDVDRMRLSHALRRTRGADPDVAGRLAAALRGGRRAA